MKTEPNSIIAVPAGLRGRFRASIGNPALIGLDGARARYAKIQLCMILWRLLVLAQIPLMLVFCPSRFTSTGYALFFFALAFIYTLIFSWLVMRTRAAGRVSLHNADLAVCALLLIVAHESALIYIFSFYAYASLALRQTLILRQALPPLIGLSLAFLVAVLLAPDPFYSLSVGMNEFLGFYVGGFAVIGFSRILDRTTSLEMEASLEAQRQQYRRRLHDDLGNTLCGLHFRIQSLKKAGDEDLRRAIGFLERGYEQATGALSRLLAGIEEIVDQGFGDSLAAISRQAGEEYGLDVRVNLPGPDPEFSPEVRRQVLAIIREAVINAARHSHGSEIQIDLTRRQGTIAIVIADYGAGFDPVGLKKKQEQGSMGIRGMNERAAMIGGVLDIQSGSGAGTTVTLRIAERTSSGLSRFAGLQALAGGSAYQLLVRLKFMVACVIVAQVPLMEPQMRNDPLVWVIAGAIMVDSTIWLLFSSRIYDIVTRWPWLLVLEQIFFSLTIFLCWRAGLPMLFDMAPTFGLVVSACFLSISGNVALASFLGLGMIAADLLAPASASFHAQRMEEMVVNITSNLLVALCSGLAVEFISSLERLQHGVAERALARQREQMTAETHKQLYTLVHDLGDDIRKLIARGIFNPAMKGELIHNIESSSTHIKKRLREMLRSLEATSDQPSEEKAA